MYAILKWEDIQCLKLADTSALDIIARKWLDSFVGHASMVESPDETLERTRNSATANAMTIYHLDIFLSLSLLTAGIIYGGIHLLAWNRPFDTLRERFSCLITASPIVVRFLTQYIPSTANDLSEKGRASWFQKAAMFTLETLLSAYTLVYCAARLFMVVNCFINLTHLPPEVYTESSWSRYIPHFSAG